MAKRNAQRRWDIERDGLSADDVALIEAELANFAVPELASTKTEALIAGLTPAVRANHAEALNEALQIVAAIDETGSAASAASWFRLARAQVSVLRPAFWVSTLLIAVIGAVVQYALQAPGLVLFAPVLAALGVAYAFRPSLTGTWEMEFACPVRPFEWLMARFGVVVAYDLALLCLATPAFSAGHGELFAWRMALLWLGPLLFLSGIALQASLRWGAVAGTMLPLACWGGLLVLATVIIPGLTLEQPSLPALTGAGAQTLWLLAMVAGVALIAQAPRIVGRWGGASLEA